MSTATVPPFRGRYMGYLVDRQFKTCDKCGGKIQVDTASSPGAYEDSPPVLETIESHLGSCSPQEMQA